MGLGTDTSCTFEFVLEADKDRPAEERPALTFRFLSVRDYRKVDALFADTLNKDNFDTVCDTTLQGIRLALAGWKNQAIAYDPAELDTILTPVKLLEIRNRLLSEMTLNELDKKKFRLPSPSSTGDCASARTESAAPVPPS